jgi:hypothetical protein
MVKGADGNLHGVKYISYSAIQGRPKLLLPKWDTVQKHAGHRRAFKDIEGVCKKGEYYFSSTCVHARNATLYASRGQRTVIELQRNENFRGDRACKKVQFATVFHVLSEGRPMIEYESM